MDIKENIKNTVTKEIKEKGGDLADKAMKKTGTEKMLGGMKDQAVNKAAECAGDIIDSAYKKIVK